MSRHRLPALFLLLVILAGVVAPQPVLAASPTHALTSWVEWFWTWWSDGEPEIGRVWGASGEEPLAAPNADPSLVESEPPQATTSGEDSGETEYHPQIDPNG